MESNVLEVVNLSKIFKKDAAVDNISFSLRKGEIVGLTGPNGAGKTTTIKCILGLLRKTKGEILVDGFDSTLKKSKYKLAYIPETPDIYPMLTVWEHLKFMSLAYYIKDWESTAEQILKKFDLTDKKNELGKNLSKGMRQKVSICCALIHKPDVFLVDEPLIGLDPKAIRELKDAFKKLRDDGKSLLVSTHMLDSAEEFCDRIIVLKNGKLLAEGTIEELRSKVHGSENSSLEDLFLEVTQDEK
ncbi:ABC-type multidrug transport system, ATPase component [Clostridium acidisoli DSM 12555]|jgi:ABC-type multidrug transport system ATPase subunit|uniref:ABC-type multidrug transport system, ATPase component n=1 Tax=Clostridium acidisoli DSM 12555 TaxID=1121291 RepID=A0A1W1X0E4_9CLOT|nr:ABC transporter ATP-binding protein [Clostridium acidisoli]SMC16851.1 ABC-type multidrug transport system, ATPase component [Clostridium acidisoli DSM 12555]